MNRRSYMKAVVALGAASAFAEGKRKPRHVVLVMTDDQGWGQTGYYNHPLLKTPNLVESKPEVAAKMKPMVEKLAASIEDSVNGLDYPEGKVVGFDPGRRFWRDDPAYEPHFETLFKRPEFIDEAKRRKKNGARK